MDSYHDGRVQEKSIKESIIVLYKTPFLPITGSYCPISFRNGKKFEEFENKKKK